MTRSLLSIAVLAFVLATTALWIVQSSAQEELREEFRLSQAKLRKTQQELIDGQAALARQLSITTDAKDIEPLARANSEGGENSPDDSLAELVSRIEELERNTPVNAKHRMIERYLDLTGEAKAKALDELSELTKSGDEKALQHILEALDDEDGVVREAAVEAIGEIADPDLFFRLEPFLTDPDTEVREELAEALSKMPPTQAGPMLKKLLADSSSDVVDESIKSLALLDYRDALPELREITRKSDLRVAAKAGSALRKMGDEEGANIALERVANGFESQYPLERIAAIRRIRRIGGDAAVHYLKPALQDPDPSVRREAEESLARL
jgi:HEAT repeat protein